MKLLLVFTCILPRSRVCNPNLAIDSFVASLVLNKNKRAIRMLLLPILSFIQACKNVLVHVGMLMHLHKHMQMHLPLIWKICRHFESVALKT